MLHLLQKNAALKAGAVLVAIALLAVFAMCLFPNQKVAYADSTPALLAVQADGEGGDGAGLGEVDPDLKVSIDYKPVPEGKVAELVAVPNKEIGSGSYNLQWQHSSDGANWTDVEGRTVQALRVMTDDGDENRIAISEPIQIEAAAGQFWVTLGYEPPASGVTAIHDSGMYVIIHAMDKDGNPITIDPKDITYSWEMKTAATGSAWVDIPADSVEGGIDGNQLIYIRMRVKTTDGRIPEAQRVAISDPVQIVPATEPFSVTLAYDPPVAGYTAIFTSSVYAMDRNGDQITIDPSKLAYTWEKKTAATGASWVTIPGKHGASLAIPTDPVNGPVSSSKGKGEADGNQLTYIRVRVKTTDERIPEDEREAVSQAQPLTVYVGAGPEPINDNTPSIPDYSKTVKMGKKAKLGVKPMKSADKITYKSSNTKVVKVSKRGVLTPVRVGSAVVKVKAYKIKKNGKKKTKTIEVYVTVKRGSQKLVFKKQAKSVKASKLAKSARTVAIAKAKGAKTAVRYSIAKVGKAEYKKSFSINKKTGKIKVKKGTPKGTYKLRVKAKAAKGKNWNTVKKTAVITIKVK